VRLRASACGTNSCRQVNGEGLRVDSNTTVSAKERKAEILPPEEDMGLAGEFGNQVARRRVIREECTGLSGDRVRDSRKNSGFLP